MKAKVEIQESGPEMQHVSIHILDAIFKDNSQEF